jgi:hypothetical protein
MAWIQPELDWTDNAAPVGSDLNRIEGNILENHNLILAEASARLSGDQNEATERDAAILIETNARIAADNTVLSGNTSFYIENRSGSDPASASIGHMWIRIDL